LKYFVVHGKCKKFCYIDRLIVIFSDDVLDLKRHAD